jgi:hypothetical protein
MPKFQKGNRANPHGRPPGTGLAQKLRNAIANDLPDVLAALVNAAKAGDATCIKLILDRVWPALKPIDAPVCLGPLPDGLAEQARLILNATAAGELPVNVAAEWLSAVQATARVEELAELKARIEGIESALCVGPSR